MYLKKQLQKKNVNQNEELIKSKSELIFSRSLANGRKTSKHV